jgi:hypothetical protein
MTPRTQTICDQNSGSFEIDVRASIHGIREALADILHEIGAASTKPQVLGRQLGLDKSLAWKLSRVVNEEDPLSSASHLPRRSGVRILLEALQRAGAPEPRIDLLRDALAEFERMVETHCGDRETLEMMLSHTARDGQAQRDEAHRKKSFQGNSAIWGAQARVQLCARFFMPSPGSDELLDMAIIGGLVDFKRLRHNVPWSIASVRRFMDDGTPITGAVYEPLDPAVPLDQAPLVRVFCSDPTPELCMAPGQAGAVRYEIAQGPVGNTAVCTCIAGQIFRRHAGRWRTDQDRFGEHLLSLNTPAELAIHDLFVHRGCDLPLPPTLHLYSNLPGGPIYPAGGRERGLLPLHEPMISLGSSPPDVIVPEVPRYRQMVQMVMDRLGCDLRDFEGYRMKLRYPPMPTVTVFRHELRARP